MGKAGTGKYQLLGGAILAIEGLGILSWKIYMEEKEEEENEE